MDCIKEQPNIKIGNAPLSILIGSNGGLTGIYLAKQFRKMGVARIIGTDCSLRSAGKFFVDRQYQISSADSRSFIDDLLEILKKEKVDIYFPTYSKEVRIVSKYAEFLQHESNVKFIVSPFETFECLDDKETAYYSFKSKEIPTPMLISGIPCEFPVIMKKRFGSGSAGTLFIENEKKFNAFAETDPGVIFFQAIQGKEYTVDCIFDSNGNLLGCNQRERVKTIGGAVTITRNDNSNDVIPWIKKIAKYWKFCGCVNFQYILKDGTPYFIDVNLRFPSGGLPLTVESGLNIPEMLVKLLIGEDLKSQDYLPDGKPRTMYRYFEELYEID